MNSGADYIPVRLHGDEGPVGKHGRGLLVLSWNSLQCRSASTISRIVICGVPTETMIGAATTHEIYEVIAWSFSCMLTGAYPACDHKGQRSFKHT
eukprot:13484267-Alexandrium_andersonii.AAC.1